MVQQYRRVKAQHQSAILFFRMGDFYEMFYEDAEIGSQVLGIVLTARNKGENSMPMAGIPAKAIDTYLTKLLSKGYKVAICEQLTDPRESSGLVDRDVIRIITPGTLTEEGVLEAKHNNYLLSIHLGAKQIGLAWADISTGQFMIHEVPKQYLSDEIARIAPAECLLAEESRDALVGITHDTCTLEKCLQLQHIAITVKPKWYFHPVTGKETLERHFQPGALESFETLKLENACAAAGALLLYVQETQKTQLSNFERIELYNSNETMFLDQATRHCLEIQRNMKEGGRQGTFLAMLDRTCTSMGARLLTAWTSAPLKECSKIQARQVSIQELLQHKESLTKIRNHLEGVQDIERLCSKIAYQRANAKDLLALKNSLFLVPQLLQLIQTYTSPLIQQISQECIAMDQIAELLERAIQPDPKPSIKEGGIIKDGYHPQLDELRQLQTSGTQWMQTFERKEIERTGIPTLKVGYTSVFGYYIEITHAHGHKVPQNYIRKQTLKNAERYITAELKEYEDKVLSAEEKIKALEYHLFIEVRDQIAKALDGLQKLGQAIARLDVLCNLAHIAIQRDYVCPEMYEGTETWIQQGRHPVLDVENKSFVPNDLKMGPGAEIAIITGPNMAGKSTYIRQAALLILMAQIGSFIPAKKAKIGIADRIFTRIGAGDEIVQGRSTFMVEMVETASILHNATSQSFIVLDEIGRGTSTFDGISLAWAIMEYIQKKIGARTLFATHYHEIAELAEVFPNAQNYNVAIQERGEDITFLYKIVPGSADKSYGIHVAKLAGIPKEVLKRSREILSNLQQHAVDFQTYTKGCFHQMQQNSTVNTNLFTLVGEEIINTLQHVDLDNLTPLEAFEFLKKIQAEAKKL